MKPRTRLRAKRGTPSAPRFVASAVAYMTVPPGSGATAVSSAQTKLAQACQAMELRLVDVLADGEPANGRPDSRPALERAVERLEAGEVSCLVVGRLEHLSRRVDGLASLIDRLERAGARLVALDVGLDTASPTGRLALERRPVTPVQGRVYAEETPQDARVVVPTKVLGYAVLPPEAGGDIAALEEQVQGIEERCEGPALELVDVIREGRVEGKALDRPGFSYLLERIADGDAACVVVASLATLSQSVTELGRIVEMFEKKDVRLIVVELDIDTSLPGGRLTARALAAVAAAESVVSFEGGTSWPEVSRRIAAMRASGMTLQAIADALNAEGVPTPRGGAKWRPSSVQTAAGYKRRSRAKRS